MDINLSWTEFKSASANLLYKYYEVNNSYYIYAVDNVVTLTCFLRKDGSDDVIDFETNYKANALSTLGQTDADGAQIVRIKAAKRGWTYQALNFEFETSRLSSTFYCKDFQDTNVPGFTMKAYNSSLVEVTVPGLLNANLDTITQTVIDFEPTFDYEVIGGSMRTTTDILTDMRLWIVAVPDIPANMGGSKEMAVGVNLRYLTPGNVYQVDGRVSKLLTYDATYHTNKLRLIFKYPAGTNEKISIMLEYYKH